jgi:hypothetical protein
MTTMARSLAPCMIDTEKADEILLVCSKETRSAQCRDERSLSR